MNTKMSKMLAALSMITLSQPTFSCWCEDNKYKIIEMPLSERAADIQTKVAVARVWINERVNKVIGWL